MSPLNMRIGRAGATTCLTALSLALCPLAASAQSHHGTHADHSGMHDDHSDHQSHSHHHSSASAVAPAGVMGDHMMPKGKWMTSYRYMRMNMDGNRIGDDEVTPGQIVTSVPNRFFGRPMQPPGLRIVPTKMTMDMHMFGAMYGATENLTVMAMFNVISKEMEHLTFAGMNPNVLLGGFTTNSEGFGDTKITGMYRLYDDANHHLHVNFGISAPTGSIEERDHGILAPNGMRIAARLPYAMQNGTGTWDALPGLTYTGRAGNVSWGAQYRAEIRLEDENDQGYAWGDKHAATAWLAYQWAPWISTSVRVDAMTQESIDGIDPNIVAPVQTADPDFYGGERVDLLLGINLAGQQGALHGHRLAFEVGVPVHQDLNGPQMQSDWLFTLGWQKTF